MDELYGETINTASNITTNLSINSINSITALNSDNSTNDNYIKPRDYENDIISILRSSFPDLIQLKQYIYELGYIPDHLRCDIWNMLLTGATSEDYDLLSFDYTQNLSNFNGSFDLLKNDCKNLILSLSYNDNTINATSLTSDIINIIILYCLRKNKAYHPLLLNAIIPLALTSNKKSIALSSSFYSLIDNFVPFGKLDTISFELAQDTIHSWLRLLVIYHTPSVAQHLDQILPGWERPARYNTKSLEVDKLISILESTSNFDKLDRELGLDAIEDPLGWTITSDSSNSSSTDNINNDSFNGCIPNSWISGLFVNSLPSQLVAFIFDLAILEEDKYFGIYMIVTLLDIYSDILLTMTKQQLQAWFQSIYLGKFEWFKISTNPLTRNYFQSSTLDHSNPLDWKSFLSGWLQATTALRKATPNGFRKSLIETDEWSLETVITNKQAIARLLDNSKDEKNEEESNTQSNKPSEAIYSIEDDEDEEANKIEITSINQSNDSITLLQKYITICKEIKQEYINNNFYDKSINNEKKWQQDNKIDGNILNIWSTTDEVVPCIISNKRRANTTLSVSKYFELGIQNFRNNNDVKLLFPSSNQIEEPFYFGIDCRSNNEKKLGIFPKTFSLDPGLLTDSDEVNKILETLEPLASSVHLCIIGAGDDYYKWKEANSQTNKNIWHGLLINKNNSIPSTNSLNISEESNLNSVAMFFMKKSFKHVSVLDGGFVAAAKYLYENQSHNGLISNLVDCDINLLESVLGIQVSHIGTAIASNSVNGSSDSKSVSMNSLLTSFNNVTSALLKPLPVSNNQQIHSSSSPSENVADPNVVKATPVTESISLTNTKELFTGFSKKLSLFGASSYETIKKSVNTVSTTINNTISDKESNSKNDEGFILVGKKHSNVIDTQTAFVIDDDDEDEEDDLDRSNDNTKAIIKDTHGVSIQRTDTERQQALVLHRLAGIRKGDNITITKDYLPGAVLFPCFKLKPVVKSKDLADKILDSDNTSAVSNTDTNNNSETVEKLNEENSVVPVHRYLVVTKERFMVIDSNGKGVGSEAIVKSNHHLTELVKMTFRKKDPELVSLFLQNGEELKSHQYRVPKKQDFLNILQKNLQKFK